MTTRPDRPPPLWLLVLIAVVCGALWQRACAGLDVPAPLQHAFIGWLIVLGEAIWKGLEVLGRITLELLRWAVLQLWSFAKTAYNALIDLGRVAMRGLTKAWQFFRWTYDHVLKPAWLKFWKLVDSVHRTLERVLKPVFKILRRVRDELLHIYAKWVRPVLDTIEVTRKMLRVLSALHLQWAKKLDAKLGDLEEAIDRPFRLVLAKVNEIINVVNRVVTLNGLIQRLALVKSIARDWRVIGDEYARWHKPLMTADEIARRAALKYEGDDPAAPGVELGKFYSGTGGAFDGIIRELAHEWRVAAGFDDAAV